MMDSITNDSEKLRKIANNYMQYCYVKHDLKLYVFYHSNYQQKLNKIDDVLPYISDEKDIKQITKEK